MAIFKAPGRAMVALMGVVALGITGIAFIGYCAYTLPLSRPLANETPPPAILYATSAGQPLAARGVYHDMVIRQMESHGHAGEGGVALTGF